MLPVNSVIRSLNPRYDEINIILIEDGQENVSYHEVHPFLVISMDNIF